MGEATTPTAHSTERRAKGEDYLRSYSTNARRPKLNETLYATTKGKRLPVGLGEASGNIAITVRSSNWGIRPKVPAVRCGARFRFETIVK